MTNDGEEMRCLSLEGHFNSVRAVAFSPDGKQLVSGSDNCKVKLWDAATGEPPQTLDGHVDSVCAVAFSPDGIGLGRLHDQAMGRGQPMMHPVLNTLKTFILRKSIHRFSPTFDNSEEY